MNCSLAKREFQKRTGTACIFSLLAVLLFVFSTTGLWAANAAIADDPAVTEYQVKALYLYYFAKFVDWPLNAFPAKNAPIIIGIIGNDGFGTLVEEIAKNKTAQERPIVIRRLKWSADLRSCHILFISAFERKRLPQIAGLLQSSPVLTVTETDEGLQDKGIMNLVVEGGKVQFEVDTATAEKMQLRISSKLLRMAKSTTGKYLAKKE